MRWPFGALVTLGVLAGTARGESYLRRAVELTRARLDAIAAAKAPKLVPPVPVTVRWKPVRLGSLDLGAPLAAMTAGDLDGDGKSELYAVTARDVIAIGLRGARVAELGRVAFSGERATPTARDTIGSAVVDGAQLTAAVSTWARELRVAWKGKTLVAIAGSPGFLLCPDERVPLAQGRNYFLVDKTPSFGVRCATLVDRDGRPLRVRAALALSNRLTVQSDAATHEYRDVGTAFALADVDRDGTPEVIVSGAGAPGDADAVKVIELGGDDKRGLYRKAFNGGVAGVVTADLDADGLVEVIAAVRFAGATRVDLWRLN